MKKEKQLYKNFSKVSLFVFSAAENPAEGETESTEKADDFEIQNNENNLESSDQIFEQRLEQEVNQIYDNYMNLSSNLGSLSELRAVRAGAAIAGISAGVVTGGLAWGAGTGAAAWAATRGHSGYRKAGASGNSQQALKDLEGVDMGPKSKETGRGLGREEEIVEYQREGFTRFIWGKKAEIKLSKYTEIKKESENIGLIMDKLSEKRDRVLSRRNALKRMRSNSSWLDKISEYSPGGIVDRTKAWWRDKSEDRAYDLAREDLAKKREERRKKIAKIDGKLALARTQKTARTETQDAKIDESISIFKELLDSEGYADRISDDQLRTALANPGASLPGGVQIPNGKGGNCATLNEVLGIFKNLKKSERRKIGKLIKSAEVASAEKEKRDFEFKTSGLDKFNQEKIDQRIKDQKRLDNLYPQLKKSNLPLHVRNLSPEVVSELGLSSNQVSNMQRVRSKEEAYDSRYITFKTDITGTGEVFLCVPNLNSEVSAEDLNRGEYIVTRISENGKEQRITRPINELAHIGLLMSDDYQNENTDPDNPPTPDNPSNNPEEGDENQGDQIPPGGFDGEAEEESDNLNNEEDQELVGDFDDMADGNGQVNEENPVNENNDDSEENDEGEEGDSDNNTGGGNTPQNPVAPRNGGGDVVQNDSEENEDNNESSQEGEQVNQDHEANEDDSNAKWVEAKVVENDSNASSKSEVVSLKKGQEIVGEKSGFKTWFKGLSPKIKHVATRTKEGARRTFNSVKKHGGNAVNRIKKMRTNKPGQVKKASPSRIRSAASSAHGFAKDAWKKISRN